MEKVRVMIVDDSKISRTILANHLSKTNFEVVAMAADAAEALKMYQEHNPEIVTMDMNLPDADGIECSKKIRGFDPDAKIVMISAMKDASLVAQGRAAGISSFLQKPVSTNDIIETLLLLSQQRVNKIAVLRESYAKAFERALQQGILNLIGMQSKITTEVYDKRYLSIDGIAVIIGLTGYPVGRAVMHVSNDTMKKFAETMLGTEEVAEDEIHEAVEEAANIVIGRGVSNINDVFKDKEMRITPPGTIFGSGIKISSPKLTTFRLTASTEVGDIVLNVGFAEGE
ncbi:MAG: response regulator [Selenomonadaceae bacterium]|nr:response regulator [Selenomonadaceae bacterium]